MRRGVRAFAAVIVSLFFVVAVWMSLRSDEFSGTPSTPAAQSGSPTSGTDADRAPKPSKGSTSPDEQRSSTPAIPAPVDFDAVDRDRDLHGVVVRRDGTAVAGAEIVVLRRPWGRANFLHVGDERAVEGPRTWSAVDGSFSMCLHRGERVRLRIAASGFPDTTVRERQAGERVRIVLDPGVRLRISVVDEDNRVLPGVEMSIHPSWSMRADDLDVERRVTTGPDGVAVAEGVPARARVWVLVQSSGFGYPREHDVTELGDGGETHCRLVMERGRPLRGCVVDDATGAPVAGARVGKGWALACSVACDPEGRFVLPDWVDRGGYQEIAAFAAGYARGEFVVGGQSELELRLHRGLEAIGRVVDGQRRPVADALVEMVASVRNGSRLENSVGDAVSGHDGRFHIAGLHPEMPHVLVVAAVGLGRVRRPAPRKAGSSMVDLGDVVLPGPRLVAGVVLDSAGAPRSRVPVTIFGPRIAQPIPPETPGEINEVFAADDNGCGSEEEVITDDLGRFAFADLAPGAYQVRAEAEGADDVTAEVDVPPHRDVTDLRLKVESGRKIEFHVVDEKGAPLPGVRADVHIPSRGPPLVARTDESGVARFDAPDSPAQYTLEVDATRFATIGLNEFHDVPADGVVRVVLFEAARLEGVVRDADGKPISRALLRFAVEGQREHVMRVDDAGAFHQSVPRGVATRIEVVGISGRRGEPDESDLVGSTQVVPPATGLVRVAERVATDRTLSVLVTSPDGVAVAGATVEAHRVTGGSLKTAETDAQGTAKFVGLPARPIVVGMSKSAHWALPTDAHVTPSGQKITLALRRAAEIRGVVVDDAGKPAKCSIFAFVDENVEGTASTGEDGRFLLRVPIELPGPYKVEAQAESGPGDGAVESVRAGGPELKIVVR